VIEALAPEKLTTLRRIATIESVGSSTRIEGSKLSDAEVEKLLTEETKLDAAARLKIASQRKIILEGSQEWEILYRKYYNDEVKKLGL
jgi:hypothetical protein